ncbi:N-6 DNA methylase [Allokutzneria sp. A3M-2-11 16]|uniref:N-6 DNA methylase n=1 Tax=Allokutzneria sp. A3M-2-11 16 TaxID=2962043 RepID=UPI0020B79B0A|nr:N-6 DNA methylase [Allokutzneria sp. A3M-2-11 16]MCP3805246.1 N-6 DNA methylase [Allokutzneria sp. A3M-2-11 16]
MNQDATVNAGEIARLVDVGRAAVSNWRRRHDDFPQPVGGTASSPLFSLREVEEWLRRNGKVYRLSWADRAWQRLRAEGDDLRLGELVASAAVLLLRDNGFFVSGEEPADTEALLELAKEHGPAQALDLICERYVEAHSRRLTVTAPDVAELMIRLAGANSGTVLDPACGLGTLLLGGSPARALGQDIDPSFAKIASARLVLRGLEAEVVCADSLQQNGFPDVQADAVVCEPPFNERAWGYAELTGDPRWEYGLPPRGEPELAWVQHCLAHVRPGGRVAILLPSAAASRRPGRRIRGNLLRAGALRAVITLPGTGSDLWLLRRPEPQDRPPSQLVLMEAGPDLSTVDLEAGEGVRIIDLLDDDVDISPARHRGGGDRDLGREFSSALDRFRALAPAAVPALDVFAQRRSLPTTTLGELVKAGLVSVRHSPTRMSEGDRPVLTVDDLAEGRAPTGRAGGPDLVTAEPGDVIASPLGVARVATTTVTLGAHLAAYRVDPERMDADFLAGALRAGDHRAHLGSSRVDARRTQLPRLSLAEQRAYGAAFRRLAELADTLRETAAAGQALVRLGFDGLVDGSLGPRG